MAVSIAPLLLKMTTLTGYLAVSLVLLAGWLARDYRYVVAESGLGYWLGIIGGTLMLILLLYPLRKRFRRWGALGSVRFWFRLHMFFGIVGPALVLFHSGFRLGSFNSSVALFCMLLVAGSGLLGRYLYARIHHGLYGSKIRFEEFYSDVGLAEILAPASGIVDPAVVEEFGAIEAQLTDRRTGTDRSYWYYRSMRKRIGRVARAIRRAQLDRRSKRHLLQRLGSLRSICKLGINEILFSYWHVLHLPLFVMMILSGLVHVTAVHLY